MAPGRHVGGDDGAGADNRLLADLDAGQDRCPGADLAATTQESAGGCERGRSSFGR